MNVRVSVNLSLHGVGVKQKLANGIHGYTNKVCLRGLRKNQGLKPTQVGFACVDAVSNRPFYVKLTPLSTAKPLPRELNN
jgi:hypothetical protein